MAIFEINKTYFHGFIGDGSIRVEYTVTKRSKVNVWLKDHGNGQIIRRKIHVMGDGETCQPEGNYAFAPTLRASHVAK